MYALTQWYTNRMKISEQVSSRLLDRIKSTARSLSDGIPLVALILLREEWGTTEFEPLLNLF